MLASCELLAPKRIIICSFLNVGTFFGKDFPHESVSSIYLSMLATLLIAISKKLTIGSKIQEYPLTKIRIKSRPL